MHMVLLAALLLCSWSGAVLAQERASALALVGATVHVGDGAAPIADAAVLIAGERIVAVGPRDAVPLPDGARVVDLSGKHIAPGLVDTHVHYSQTGWVDGRPDAADVRDRYPYEATMATNALHPERFHLAFLHAGVTAVLDCGGYPWTRRLGEATEHDPYAPHVAAAGALLATYDPKVLTLPDQQQFVFPHDADEARRFVRLHAAFGSAFVKVWYITTPEHPLEELSPIVHAAGEEARAVRLPLIVHATTLDTVRDAIAAGAHLLVHSVEDREIDDDFVAAAKAAGTFYCPTLTVRRGYFQVYSAAVDAEVLAQLDGVHPTVAARVRATEELPVRVPQRALQGMAKRFELAEQTMAKNLLRLHQAGVPVVLGTDAGNPLTLHGPSVWPELEAMAAAGLTPGEVLVAATWHAAQAMRREDFGRVASDSWADLVVLDADPEQDVTAWRTVQQVVRAGVLHERAALRQRGE
ncbi:MAG: amidohydrolase family protein [Planctomycetes bacterium]|nr:amidohydrolase family protein [Planctomycetota bacterium]